ncbi:hypothetical protein [Desulfobacterium sp. N47]|uniref:Chromosome partition protein Smc n=1 Tax=uncultured Desulfobacterium sp. TaxID=201089 RepID=E1YK27_9BACT|nr:hypothetical protein N47_E51430 [uncultured Desulfobacterium sp.]
MKQNISKIIIVLLLVTSGLALGLGYGHLRLRKERAVFAENTGQMKSREELLKRKYMEQKALSGQITSSKLMVEGEKRAFEEKAEKLSKEKEAIASEYRTLGENLKKDILSLEQKNKTIEEKKIKLESDIQKNEEKYRQEIKACNHNILEKENELKKITSEMKSLEQNFKRITQGLERCKSNNARLCVITGELVDKYRNKGVTKSILSAEPFTQLQKVEMEKLIQDYMERIEKEQIDKKDIMPKFNKYLSKP